MANFTVIKEVVSTYAVVVEAEDATDAIIQARADNHEPGDLITDDTQNETTWQVFAGDDLEYPIDDAKAIPTDSRRILLDMGMEVAIG